MMRDNIKQQLINIFPVKWLTQLANALAFPFSVYYRWRYYPHLIIRKGTSDMTVFRQIFVGRDYDVQYDRMPRLIIDGGANVGYSSLFFADKFPHAEIFAIEPETSNFKLLEHNVSICSNVHSIQRGLWSKSGFLRIINKGSDKHAFMTMEVAEGEPYDVEVITVDEILRLSRHTEIDILKLDIEGAEKELFSSNFDCWLGKVNMIIIELHDNMKEGCGKAFFSAVEKYGFTAETRGENIILRKK